MMVVVKRMLVVFFVGVFLGACTTGEMLESVGNNYSRGNYVAGTVQLPIALAIGPIMDVFTLGGSLTSPEQVSQVAVPAIAAASNPRYQTSSEAMQRTRNLSDSSAGYGSLESAISKPYQSQEMMGKIADASCLKVESIGRDSLVYGSSEKFVLRNVCSYSISGAYCIAQEQYAVLEGNNNCARGAGNFGHVFAPGQSVDVSSHLKPGGSIKVKTAGCVSPADIDVMQFGDAISFRCIIPASVAGGVN
ncbi:hypothetical protein [Pseudomonas oryzihabitans]|uniref:hypothetical protein n=1 Tax=Pseudomonas oryzihabitans TaxID=47885 RepID=UPI001123BE76|nr:hypothetical protein [Pseudomonas psychrotolerans]